MTEQFGASDMAHTMMGHAEDMKCMADVALPEDPTVLGHMLADLGRVLEIVQPLHARVADIVMDGEELRVDQRRR